MDLAKYLFIFFIKLLEYTYIVYIKNEKLNPGCLLVFNFGQNSMTAIKRVLGGPSRHGIATNGLSVFNRVFTECLAA